MGQGWQGLGLGHEELSPAASLLGGRIEAFSQHSSCWSNYNGFTLTQLCSEQKLSSGKVCYSCPASVFAYAWQTNNISCWVIGNKCKKFWVYDANPYCINSPLLYKDFSDHGIWHSKACGLAVRAGCSSAPRSCLELGWGWETPGGHTLPTHLLVLLCAKPAGSGVSELWRDGDPGYGGSVELQGSTGFSESLLLQSHRTGHGWHWLLPSGQKLGVLHTIVVTVERRLLPREGCRWGCWGRYSKSTKLPTKMWTFTKRQKHHDCSSCIFSFSPSCQRKL